MAWRKRSPARCIAPLLVVNPLLCANPGWSNPALPFVWALAIAYVVGRFSPRDGQEAKVVPAPEVV